MLASIEATGNEGERNDLEMVPTLTRLQNSAVGPAGMSGPWPDDQAKDPVQEDSFRDPVAQEEQNATTNDASQRVGGGERCIRKLRRTSPGLPPLRRVLSKARGDSMAEMSTKLRELVSQFQAGKNRVL